MWITGCPCSLKIEILLYPSYNSTHYTTRTTWEFYSSVQVFKRSSIQEFIYTHKMSSFYVNYRSFLVSKNLVLNVDDFVVKSGDYQYNNYQEVDIYNAHTKHHIQATVAFIPAMGDDNTYILTNLADVKYDLFEVACIVRHFDTPQLSHNTEMSFKNMNDFMFRVTIDDANLTRDLARDERLKAHVYNQAKQRELQQQSQQQPQHPPNEYLKALHKYVENQAQAHQAYAHHVQQQAYAHQAYANHIEQQALQQQPQQLVRETPSQELSHYQSKKTVRKTADTPSIKIGRQKFRKLFEEAIRDEPQLHINRTIDDTNTEYNYGFVPLAIDIPSFKTDDDQYNENY